MKDVNIEDLLWNVSVNYVMSNAIDGKYSKCCKVIQGRQ